MTVMLDRACPDLGQATDEELARLWDARSDPGLAAAIDAELEDRDRRRREQPARRQARRDDPDEAEWRLLMEAQLDRAENACNGELVKRGSWVEDPRELWRGTWAFARAHATWELLRFWELPNESRITITEYKRQAAGQGRNYSDELEMGRDAAGAVRPAGTEREAAPVHRDGRRRDVPDPDTGGGPEVCGSAGSRSRPAGHGIPVRGRTVTGTRLDGQPYSPAMQAAKARNAGTAWPQAPAEVAVVEPAEVASREPRAGQPGRRDVDGAQVLSYARKFLGHFGVWPSDALLTTAALWAVQAHAKDEDGMPAWQYASRMFFTSREAGWGKTRLAKLTAFLAPDPHVLVESTKAALVGRVTQHKTVLITEIDELFRTPNKNRPMVAIINSGYEPDGTSDKQLGGKTVDVPVFGPMILDGLDTVISERHLKATMSRCIIGHVRKAPEGYRAPRFDKQARQVAQLISQRAALWMANEVACGIGDVIPEVPEGLGNRPAALWEPLFCVALAADKKEREGEDDPRGFWWHACAEACASLETATGIPDETEDESDQLDAIMGSWGDDEL